MIERWSVDKSLATPAYLQLAERIRGAVARGELSDGSALPSERELATSLDLSRMTVRRAVDMLVEERLLTRRHGSGTYVSRPSLEQTFDRVLGFTDEARNLGFVPGSRLLDAGKRGADDDVARNLALAGGTPVLMVRRLRTADGEPLAIQTAYIPPAYAGLSIELLRKRGSLYRSLHEQFGLSPHRARQSVSARLPDHLEREQLEIGAFEPVLALERLTFDAIGNAFEYVRSAYRGDRYRLALELRPPEGEYAGSQTMRGADEREKAGKTSGT